MNQDSEYGLVISPPGIDVNKCKPEDAIIDSRFNTLKVPINDDQPLFGTIIVNCTTAPTGTTRILTVNHNFKYRPLCLTYFDRSKSTTGMTVRPRVTGIFEVPATGLDGYRFEAKANTTDFWIELNFNAADTPTYLIGKVFAFRYYVFAEDADADS